MSSPAPGHLPAIAFAAVAKTYGATVALDAITLDVQSGEIFALVGENGAGKTTLIKCLLDFCQTDAGEIRLFGRSHSLTRARRELAFLPERFIPPHYLAGRDFLRYMAEMHHTVYDETRAAAILQRLDLELSALTRPVRDYSKGMTQKLGLAACLLSGKPLQVLDEPASGLDPKARARLKAELRAVRDTGTSVFFTSHALADVQEICDRMAILHQGRLRFAGAPAELTARYGNVDLESAFLECIAAPVQP